MFLFFKGVAKKLCGERPKNDDDIEAQKRLIPLRSKEEIWLNLIRTQTNPDADPPTKYGTTPKEPRNTCIIS
jgi:hypothetical protein